MDCRRERASWKSSISLLLLQCQTSRVGGMGCSWGLGGRVWVGLGSGQMGRGGRSGAGEQQHQNLQRSQSKRSRHGRRLLRQRRRGDAARRRLREGALWQATRRAPLHRTRPRGRSC